MAIKKAEKNKADEAVQRKNKVNTSVDNEIIIIDDDENDSDDCSDLQTKVEVKKKKDLVKGKGSYHKGTKKKKKKKRDSDKKNKAGRNLLIITESSSDLELLTKNGKVSRIVKKKGEQRLPCEEDGNCEVFSKGLLREQQGPNFLFSHSSKRKSPDSNRDGGECIKKMKKKKKKKHKPTSSLMLHREDNEAEFQKLIIPNVETISQDVTLSDRKNRGILVKNNVSNTVKEKNLLDYIIDVDDEDSSDGISEKRIATPVYHLQEENHCKRRTLGCKGHQDSAAQVSEKETRVIRKKQKKKKTSKEKTNFATATKNQENNSGISNENLLQLKSRETQEDVIPDSQRARRVTSKKTIHTEDVSNHAALLEDSEDASTARKRKKKVKKCKAVQACRVSGNSESSSKQHLKKKRKNKDRRTVDRCEEEPSLKKGKLKKETKVREDEIKVVAFKKGNCDEINIDKSRRRALQEEIDRESGKTKVIKEEGELESDFGQWSTATFETSERKSKFLRLLGGFKKGSSVSSQDPPAHFTKLNMALDWNREQNLQQDLQAEFEKAVDRKHHRGTGLGFHSATQKHTHIDKYASKSIKFEA